MGKHNFPTVYHCVKKINAVAIVQSLYKLKITSDTIINLYKGRITIKILITTLGTKFYFTAFDDYNRL